MDKRTDLRPTMKQAALRLLDKRAELVDKTYRGRLVHWRQRPSFPQSGDRSARRCRKPAVNRQLGQRRPIAVYPDWQSSRGPAEKAPACSFLKEPSFTAAGQHPPA